jgi:predicted Zn-dependent peptidase
VFTAGDMQARMNLHGQIPEGPAVILGGGDIGLIMAGQLAEAGIEVTVVEQRERCGAMARNRRCLEEFPIRLLCGDTSQMYQKLYEEGVIDSSFGGGFQILGDGAMMIFSGDSDDPRRVREEILAEAQRICREGISREDFLRMKRSVLGEMIRGLDSFEGLCSRLYIYHLCDYDFFRFPALFDTIEPREVLDFLAEIIREENSCLSVIHPNE